ncbi:hypothetical protein JAAARDRAFT_427620, partial [Jaapia argillacea MUCL 33604]
RNIPSHSTLLTDLLLHNESHFPSILIIPWPILCLGFPVSGKMRVLLTAKSAGFRELGRREFRAYESMEGEASKEESRRVTVREQMRK